MVYHAMAPGCGPARGLAGLAAWISLSLII